MQNPHKSQDYNKELKMPSHFPPTPAGGFINLYFNNNEISIMALDIGKISWVTANLTKGDNETRF
jgi:hypothetical protein